MNSPHQALQGLSYYDPENMRWRHKGLGAASADSPVSDKGAPRVEVPAKDLDMQLTMRESCEWQKQELREIANRYMARISELTAALTRISLLSENQQAGKIALEALR